MIEGLGQDRDRSSVLCPVEDGLYGPSYERDTKPMDLKQLRKFLNTRGPDGSLSSTATDSETAFVRHLHSSVKGVKRRLITRGHVGNQRPQETNIQISYREKARESFTRVLNVLLPPSKPREYTLMTFVTFLFVVIFATFIAVDFAPEDQSSYIYSTGGITFNARTLAVEVSNLVRGETVLRGHLWRRANDIPGYLPTDCSTGRGRGGKAGGICLTWAGRQRLLIDTIPRENNVTCYQIQWEALSPNIVQMDCFDLEEDVHWFGGGLINDDAWPLERASVSCKPFIAGDVHDRDSLGPVLEPYWLTSQGVSIIVQDSSQLDISFNECAGNQTDQRFCLYSGANSVTRDIEFKDQNKIQRTNTNLKYSICSGNNIRHIHKAMLRTHFVPNQTQHEQPDMMMLITDPVWSTWAYFKMNLNQTTLMDFIQMINTSTSTSQRLLMIDDGWERHHGDMTFDPSRFTDPGGLIKAMYDAGFNVSISQHPYVSTDSPVFQEASLRSYLVREGDENVPRLSRYQRGPHPAEWNGHVVGVVDIANNNASTWQIDRINGFKRKNDVYRVHFSGGEICHSRTFSTLSTVGRNVNFAQRFVELAGTFGDTTSIQLAHRSQTHLPLVRLTGTMSNWKGYAGLTRVIPSALALGIIGYPLFIPDPIGGSAYDELPSKELYIRWLQITVFFPVVHFSIPAERYDYETVLIVKRLLEFRKYFVVPELLKVLNESLHSLIPLVRPLWWVAPSLNEAVTSSSQFMIGDDLIVAPILDEGHVERDIFIPPGAWEDMTSNTGKIHVGPVMLRHHHVPLDKVAYFIRRHFV